MHPGGLVKHHQEIVLPDAVDGVIAFKDMSHEPVGFRSEVSRDSQLRWATLSAKGFASESTFQQVKYLLWGGVRIQMKHRNFSHIFQPKACVSSVIAAIWHLENR